jgi:hypothetical protein
MAIFSPALFPVRTMADPIFARLAAFEAEDVGVAPACPVVTVWLPFPADAIEAMTMIPMTATATPVMTWRTRCRFLRRGGCGP